MMTTTGVSQPKGQFTKEKVSILIEMFKQTTNPTREEKTVLSANLGLSMQQLTTWFQNRRHRKKERSTFAALEGIDTHGHNNIVPKSTPLTIRDQENIPVNHYLDNLGRILMEPQSPELVDDDQYQVHDGSIISITSKGPLLDLDDLATNLLFSTNINYPPNIYHVATDYSHVQSKAVQELIKLANDEGGTFWKTVNGREVLSEFDYNQNFPKPNRNSKTRFEASRALDEVTMDHKDLVNMLINNDCLNELFPTIVTNAKLIHALSPGKSVDNPDGSVQLMYKEIQLTNPLVPNMKLIFIRICKKMDDGCWVVVDASFDPPKEAYYPTKYRRLPSGCLIESIGNGLSKVKWVEHLEIEENTEFDNQLTRAKAYGALRWVECLKRACERISYKNAGTQWSEERRRVMNLGTRMLKNFFECVGATYGTNIWSRILILNEMKVHTTLRSGHDGMIIGAAATVHLSHSPESVFEMLIDERNRHKWDVLGGLKPHKKTDVYKTGTHPGNYISILQVDDTTESIDTPLQLQEASIDQYGSLLVSSYVNAKSFESIKLGNEAINTPLMTSLGFSISPGDHQTAMSSTTAGSSSTSSGVGGGSNVTLAVQIILNSQPSEEMEIHMIKLAANAIKETILNVDRILYEKDLETQVTL